MGDHKIGEEQLATDFPTLSVRLVSMHQILACGRSSGKEYLFYRTFLIIPDTFLGNFLCSDTADTQML